jgi:hypothetical protein
MLHKFAACYGWTVQQIMKLTYFQVKELSLQIDKRELFDRRILADIIRVANHADKNQYDRFLSSLDLPPQLGSETASPATPSSGFGHVKE